jgi:hypothetical protein
MMRLGSVEQAIHEALQKLPSDEHEAAEGGRAAKGKVGHGELRRWAVMDRAGGIPCFCEEPKPRGREWGSCLACQAAG